MPAPDLHTLLLLTLDAPERLMTALLMLTVAYGIFHLLGFGTGLIASTPLAWVMPVPRIIPLLALLDALSAIRRGWQARRQVDLGALLATLEQFVREAPGVRVDLDRLSSEQQMRELAEGRADLGLARMPVLRRDPELEVQPLAPEPLWVALPADHPLAAREGLWVADLAEVALVSAVHRERGGLARRVADLCLSRGFVPRLAPVISRKTSMLTLVGAGFGGAVIPAGMRALVPGGVVLRPLLDEDAWA